MVGLPAWPYTKSDFVIRMVAGSIMPPFPRKMFQTSDHRLADEGPHSLNPLEVAGARTKTWIPFSTYPDIATILEDRAVSEDRSFLFTHFDQSLLPEQSRKRSSKKRKVSCVIRDPLDMHQEIIKYRDNQIMPEREVAGMSLKGEQALLHPDGGPFAPDSCPGTPG